MPTLHRIALRFAYDGSMSNGYARQPEGDTVEDTLIAALEAQGLVEGSWRTGSRTDRGVAAAENVAACTLDRPHLRGLIPALQADLPDGVWALGAAPVTEAWNPRRAARTYLYVQPRHGEDRDRMQQAATAFIGEHDMSAFARVEPPRDPMRRILSCTVTADGDAWHFRVSSPGFLWNQVRRMVDAMLRVGRGAATVEDIRESLKTGRPHPSFKLANAAGLLLERVEYTPGLAWEPEAGRVVVTDRTAQRVAVQRRLVEALHANHQPSD